MNIHARHIEYDYRNQVEHNTVRSAETASDYKVASVRHSFQKLHKDERTDAYRGKGNADDLIYDGISEVREMSNGGPSVIGMWHFE